MLNDLASKIKYSSTITTDGANLSLRSKDFAIPGNFLKFASDCTLEAWYTIQHNAISLSMYVLIS